MLSKKKKGGGGLWGIKGPVPALFPPFQLCSVPITQLQSVTNTRREIKPQLFDLPMRTLLSGSREIAVFE